MNDLSEKKIRKILTSFIRKLSDDEFFEPPLEIYEIREVVEDFLELYFDEEL